MNYDTPLATSMNLESFNFENFHADSVNVSNVRTSPASLVVAYLMYLDCVTGLSFTSRCTRDSI